MRELSKRQREVLEFLEAFSAANGMAPTICELAAHFEIAPATAAGHLRALQKKRRLVRSSKARSIVFAEHDTPDAILKIPVYGRLADPVPEENRSYWEGVTYLHRSVLGRSSRHRLFALRMGDESMRGLGIYRGDVAIFAPPEPVPRFGDVVAVFVDGDVLVRSFFPRSSGTVSLSAAHPEIPALELAPESFKLVGVLIALQRDYPR